MPQISEKFKSYIISTSTIYALIFCQCEYESPYIHEYACVYVCMCTYTRTLYVGRKLCVGLRSILNNDRWALACECL